MEYQQLSAGAFRWVPSQPDRVVDNARVSVAQKVVAKLTSSPVTYYPGEAKVSPFTEEKNSFVLNVDPKSVPRLQYLVSPPAIFLDFTLGWISIVFDTTIQSNTPALQQSTWSVTIDVAKWLDHAVTKIITLEYVGNNAYYLRAIISGQIRKVLGKMELVISGNIDPAFLAAGYEFSYNIAMLFVVNSLAVRALE